MGSPDGIYVMLLHNLMSRIMESYPTQAPQSDRCRGGLLPDFDFPAV